MDAGERINYLVGKFFTQTCTAEEKAELARWIAQSAGDDALRQVLEQAWRQYETGALLPEAASERILANLFTAGPEARQRPEMAPLRGGRRSIAWKAAAVVALLGGAAYYWFAARPAKDPVVRNGAPVVKTAVPGGNRAVLTLADGSSITLDSARNGALALQGSATITKLANGQLAYTAAGGSAGKVLYNTIATPKGGQYRLLLPDGSSVWLNAASSLRFPAVFSGASREVELKGEAFFEIAGDAHKPFLVKVNGMQVTVLGTTFNVNAYDDEMMISTTLVTGSVKVAKDGASHTLRPGQQAQLDAEGAWQVRENADLESILAWKNGRFQFDGAGIEQVMRQIARWYNVEVTYRGGAIKQHFSGGIARNAPLSQVFSMLEATGAVHLSLENGKVIVTP